MLTYWLAMDPPTLDKVFAAMANEQRRRMLDVLRHEPGVTIAGLATHFAMSGVGVLKHVKVLEAAGLIVSRKVGRERHLYFNVMPIQLVYDQWTDQYSRFWAGRVADIKAALESGDEAFESRKAARRA